MLDTFTLDTFAPLVGETFRVIVDDRHELVTELVSARPWGTEADARHVRVPFTLTFRGPGVIPQQIYEVRNETLGAFEIFLVPVGPDGQGMQYEAVFA